MRFYGWNDSDDVVWSQMGRYWVAAGQLTWSEVDAWERAGRDEHGFYQLGTTASYGHELGGDWSWPQEAHWAGLNAAGVADLDWSDPMSGAWS